MSCRLIEAICVTEISENTNEATFFSIQVSRKTACNSNCVSSTEKLPKLCYLLCYTLLVVRARGHRVNAPPPWEPSLLCAVDDCHGKAVGTEKTQQQSWKEVGLQQTSSLTEVEKVAAVMPLPTILPVSLCQKNRELGTLASCYGDSLLCPDPPPLGVSSMSPRRAWLAVLGASSESPVVKVSPRNHRLSMRYRSIAQLCRV